MHFEFSTDAKPDPIPYADFAAIFPHIVWAGVIIFVLIWFGRHRLWALLRRVEKISVGGFELNLFKELTNAADKRNQTIPVNDVTRLSRRLYNNDRSLRGATLLWIDNKPAHNLSERRILEEHGVEISIARSTVDALEQISTRTFDVVVSNIKRGHENGLSILNANPTFKTVPVIFYVGKLDPQKPTPLGAFGITNRPDALLHLVIDALSRCRG